MIKTSVIKKAFIYVWLGILTIIALFPLFYILTNAFMGSTEFIRFYGDLSEWNTGRNAIHIIPDWISWEGFHQVFYTAPHYLYRFWISLVLSGGILAGQLVVSVLGGYAFSRFRFPGRDVIFFIVVVLMMMPPQVMLVPSYITLDSFGLLGSYWALILPGVFSAFGVFLTRQFMIELPNEIFEAARVDGAGVLRQLWSVCLPNSKHALAALAILNFVDSWNMVEQPLVFLRDSYKFPLSVFLTQVNESSPEIGFVAGILSVIPTLLLFLHYKDEMAMGIEYAAFK